MFLQRGESIYFEWVLYCPMIIEFGNKIRVKKHEGSDLRTQASSRFCLWARNDYGQPNT